jgi:hypothetical protein
MITNSNKLALLIGVLSIATSFANAAKIVTHGANDVLTN